MWGVRPVAVWWLLPLRQRPPARQAPPGGRGCSHGCPWSVGATGRCSALVGASPHCLSSPWRPPWEWQPWAGLGPATCLQRQRQGDRPSHGLRHDSPGLPRLEPIRLCNNRGAEKLRVSRGGAMPPMLCCVAAAPESTAEWARVSDERAVMGGEERRCLSARAKHDCIRCGRGFLRASAGGSGRVGSSVKNKSAKHLLALRVAVQWMRNKRRAHGWPPSTRDQRSRRCWTSRRHLPPGMETAKSRGRRTPSAKNTGPESVSARPGMTGEQLPEANTHALRGAKVRAQYRWLHAASGIQK